MKKLMNYDDNTRKLQTKWATKLSWAKGQVSDGDLFIRYKTYFLIEFFKKDYRCKWNNLIKHQGCRITI
jgi:hypothetical protein